MLAPESTFWICLGKCAHWLLEIQDSRNRLSEWGELRSCLESRRLAKPQHLTHGPDGAGQSRDHHGRTPPPPWPPGLPNPPPATEGKRDALGRAPRCPPIQRRRPGVECSHRRPGALCANAGAQHRRRFPWFPPFFSRPRSLYRPLSATQDERLSARTHCPFST